MWEMGAQERGWGWRRRSGRCSSVSLVAHRSQGHTLCHIDEMCRWRRGKNSNQVLKQFYKTGLSCPHHCYVFQFLAWGKVIAWANCSGHCAVGINISY
jgi:hypothetical protein